jgi:L-cysteine desulfidase
MSYTVKDVLRLEVAPALGCTEPVAAALGAAAARSLLPAGEIKAVSIEVDPNIYKNGVAVFIPGTDGLFGLDTAAAIGAAGGDPTRKLEVLSTIDDETIAAAKRLLAEEKVTLTLLKDRRGIYIHTTVRVDNDTAESVIEALHDNITALRVNGEPVTDHPLLSGAGGGSTTGGVAEMESWLKTRSLQDLVSMLGELDTADRAFIAEGVKTNMKLAEHGLMHGSALGVGKTLETLVRQGHIQRDMIQAARILTSAAADARMAGVKLPAMSSAGSGNHGLTATLPIAAVREFTDASEAAFIEAVGLSHLLTAYIKAHTGRLSAVCGCSIAAGAGAAAGLAYLLGGNLSQIAGAIKNLAEDLAGIICDGAKPGCALKLATAAGTAVQAALFSLQGVNVRETDGIIGASPEKTMQNLGTLSTEGMIDTDRTILNIMLDKQFSGY